MVWDSIPKQLAKENNKFVFLQKTRSRAWMCFTVAEKCGACSYLVGLVQNAQIPLSSNADATYFKVYMADCGLLLRKLGLSLKNYKWLWRNKNCKPSALSGLEYWFLFCRRWKAINGWSLIFLQAMNMQELCRFFSSWTVFFQQSSIKFFPLLKQNGFYALKPQWVRLIAVKIYGFFWILGFFLTKSPFYHIFMI